MMPELPYVLLLFVASRCLVPMDETDLFFNLRLGELVLSSGRVPTENLLSFTHPHATDINLAWLFQVVLALVHRAAGIPGTVLLKTAFVLLAWAGLFRAAVRRGAAPALALPMLALAAWAAEPRFVERPHLLTFVGLAWLLVAVERAEAGRPRLLWAMVPAGLVWANGNSCYVLAPIVLLLYALGALADGLRADARRALGVALAMLPLVFATPSGWRALAYLGNHLRMPTLRPLQEYRYAEWPLDGPYFFLVAGLLLAWLLPRLVRGLPRALPWRTAIPCAALAVLGGLRIRFVAEFAMLAGPALAVAATRLLPRWRWSGRAAVGLLVALALAPRVSAVASGGRVLDLGLEAELVPFAAVDFVERNGLRDRMYNDLEVGSYLTWRGWPRYPVFQDPRINGYPDGFHAFLRRADVTRPEWQAFLDGFGVTSALITFPSLNPRGALFDPERWALVYRAGDGLVFARRPLRGALHELPLTFSFSPESGLEPVPLPTPPAGSRVSACEWARALGDHHREHGMARTALDAYQRALGDGDAPECATKARAAAGPLLLAQGDAAEAARLLDGLVDEVSRVNHGFALLRLGRAAEALAGFDGVLGAAPDNDEATFGRGLALATLGRGKEAIASFDRLLARSPGHVSAAVARRERDRLRGRP